jgi:hypothetical protein
MQLRPLCLSLLVASGAAQAALHDRGGGLIYDDVLDLTWLQDANYAKTSGYDADGVMTWPEAQAWADQLVYAGFSDWRLPSVTPINGISYQYGGSYDGSTDGGWNITSPTSQLSYMHYVNLGNIGGRTTSGAESSCGNISTCSIQHGPFINLGTGYTGWYGQAFIFAGTHWLFGTYDGYQTGQDGEAMAWAVHPGDIAAAVPEPQAWLLMAGGLAGLGFWRRRRLDCRGALNT